jgi:hypothetical protein
MKLLFAELLLQRSGTPYMSRCQFVVHLFDTFVLRPAGSRRGSARIFSPVGYATPAMTGIKEKSLHAERGDGDSAGLDRGFLNIKVTPISQVFPSLV